MPLQWQGSLIIRKRAMKRLGWAVHGYGQYAWTSKLMPTTPCQQCELTTGEAQLFTVVKIKSLVRPVIPPTTCSTGTEGVTPAPPCARCTPRLTINAFLRFWARVQVRGTRRGRWVPRVAISTIPDHRMRATKHYPGALPLAQIPWAGIRTISCFCAKKYLRLYAFRIQIQIVLAPILVRAVYLSPVISTTVWPAPTRPIDTKNGA